MMPRPRSRKKAVDVPALEVLAADVEEVTREQGFAPVAVLTGYREWQMIKRQVDHRRFVSYWPGGEETFMGVPVIVRRTAGKPEIVATQAELDELILGA